jgi:histidinol-phosphate phosphatase family protein
MVTMRSEIAILAGGFGERLSAVSGGLVKPMVPILGIPVLEYAIKNCVANGFQKILLLTGYKGEQIYDYFGDGGRFGAHINYTKEDSPRGTGGALMDALHLLRDDFLVLYADVFFDVDLKKFFSFHKQSDCDITLFVHPNDHPHDSDLIELDQDDNVLAFHSYPHGEDLELDNIVNAGIYAVRKNSLMNIPLAEQKFDIAKRLFPLALSLGRKFKAYLSSEYVKDMGTPERLEKVENSILSGAVRKLSSLDMREGVFIDRDGTILEFVEYLNHVDQIQIFPQASMAIRMFNLKGILAICITNQPVVARGELSIGELEVIHRRLMNKLGRDGAYLDRLDYCPHHPDAGFAGEIAEFKRPCDCRKPSPGLVEKWLHFYNIDKKKSWMIGDTSTDILTGHNAGLKTILVGTGQGGRDRKFDIEPDYVFPDLLESAKWICGGYENTRRLAEEIIDGVELPRFILIGGLARSGKSTFARVISDACQERGRKTHVVSIDGWLKPKGDGRDASGVSNRYNIDDFLEFVRVISNAEAEISVKCPVADSFCKSHFFSKDLVINPQDTIVLEGVVALALQSLTFVRALRLYVDVCEDMRAQRMKHYYLSRGRTESQINELLALRARDELPEIIESRSTASHIVRVVS